MNNDYFRSENQFPLVIEKWGWKFHHLGIPTKEKPENSNYLPVYKFYHCGFESSPFGIEWMFFEEDSPVHELIKNIPHLAFVVTNIDNEIKEHNLNVLTTTNSPSDGVKVAMIEHNGAPIELIEFEN